MISYEIVRELARGTYGLALHVIKKSTKENFVIKQIRVAGKTEKQKEESRQEVKVINTLFLMITF